MKILYVTPHSPFDYSSGASQRSSLILEAIISHPLVDGIDILTFNAVNYYKISEKIHKIHIVKTENNKTHFFSKIIRHFSVHKYYENRNATALFSMLCKTNKYDCVLFRYIGTVEACNCIVNKLLIDVDDLPSDFIKSKIRQTDSILKKIMLIIDYKIVKHIQKKYLLNTSNLCTFPNEADASKYNGFYLPNIPYISMPCNLCSEQESYDPYLLFVGLMSWAPNYQGIKHFIEKIWPYVKIQKLRLKIAGKGLPLDLYQQFYSDNSIDLLGYVEDLSDLYTKAMIVVVPIYSGAGTNIKVLESLAYSKPTVVSQYATRGFESDLVHLGNVMISRDDADFVKNIHMLLRNEELRNKIGTKGQLLIKEKYSKKNFICRMHTVIDEYLKR